MFVQVRFIFARLDLYLYAWIDICVSSIYMYAVRFVFVQFDLYERVLKILSVTERHTQAYNQDYYTRPRDRRSTLVDK